ncbi:MAG: hypothetical protein LBU05_01410 [Bifidobacteriaceae bacterium]|jgi:hypothetical protein|nr:hypothetical protein [Bifidobacteriaceae bacterium]
MPKNASNHARASGQRTAASELHPLQKPLSPLTATFEPNQHSHYLEMLNNAFADKQVRNIALEGPTGSSKSSILHEFADQRPKGEVIFLPLSHLTATSSDPAKTPPEESSRGDGSTGVNPTPEDLTNTIQKAIVQQIAYRQSAYQATASRFRRVKPFRKLRAAAASSAVAVVAFFTAVLFGMPEQIRPLLSAPFTRTAAWAWLMTAIGSAALGAIMYWALRVIGAARLVEARIGPAIVRFPEQADSYFDSDLDEIVHFFTSSKVRTVIFEDLDQFGAPKLFENLHSLNTAVNSSPDVPKRPVRFVYALRDSVFEPTAGAIDSQNKAATDRIKFFDLIIPVLPVISAGASQDPIRRQFAHLSENYRPSDKILQLVGPYLTDMRLLKNIRNEYEVFTARLHRSGNSAVNPDKTLAMVIYKNLHPADFEQIAHGASSLDRVYRFFHMTVESQTSELRTREEDINDQLEAFGETAPNRRETLENELADVRGLLDELLEVKLSYMMTHNYFTAVPPNASKAISVADYAKEMPRSDLLCDLLREEFIDDDFISYAV